MYTKCKCPIYYPVPAGWGVAKDTAHVVARATRAARSRLCPRPSHSSLPPPPLLSIQILTQIPVHLWQLVRTASASRTPGHTPTPGSELVRQPTHVADRPCGARYPSLAAASSPATAQFLGLPMRLLPSIGCPTRPRRTRRSSNGPLDQPRLYWYLRLPHPHLALC